MATAVSGGTEQGLWLRLTVGPHICRPNQIRRRLSAIGLHLESTDYVGQASRRYRRRAATPVVMGWSSSDYARVPPTIGCSVRVAAKYCTIPGQFYRLHCFDKSLSVALP